jgi:hypothetical protein
MTSNDGKPLFILFPIEGLVTKNVVGMAHLDDAQFSGDVVTMPLHHKMHNAIGEVVFNTVFPKLLVIFPGHFTDEERREAKSANSFKQAEDFVTWVFHFRQGEEGTKRVKDQQLEADGLPVRCQLLDQLAHPVHSVAHALLVKLDTEVREVDDGDSVANTWVINVHAHVRHVRAKGILALFKRDVNAACFTIENRVVQHGKREAGFHSTRSTRNDADVALRNASLHFFIQSFNVCRNSLQP